MVTKAEGPRKGRGRKSLSGGGDSKTVQAKVSPEQAATFKALGGAKWLRAVLDQAAVDSG